ncbi:MAG: PEP-CTERM sorting domain-containing protein [Caulobacteraceae bacterium]
MKIRGMAAALALALGTTVGAGVANATTTYLLTVDGCSSSCLGSNTEVGKVDVTASGGALNFLVTLDNGAVFNSNGNSQHHALVFDFGTALSLSGLAFSNMTSGFTGSLAGPFSDSPFGGAWDYAVDYTGEAKQGLAGSTLSFKLTDTANNLTESMLDAGATYNGKPIFLAADVFANGNTGNVGSTGGGGAVPEPATWGLMIMGVFAMGAAMRQRRKDMTVA